MGWAYLHGQRRDSYKTAVGKSEEKRPLGRQIGG
jgi:hypothetical protein